MSEKEVTKEHIAYLDEATTQQVKITYQEWENGWSLFSQARRSHVTFMGETVYHYVGRETELLDFYWFSGRLFIRVNHSAARRNLRGWERSLVESLIVGKRIQDFIHETFNIKIEDLFWEWNVDATRIKVSHFDWFETYDNPIGYVSLMEQASEYVIRIQNALMAKTYLENSDFSTFADCINPMIKKERERLKECLELKKISIFTEPKDLPITLLDADKEKRAIRLSNLAKLYEKWLSDT